MNEQKRDKQKWDEQKKHAPLNLGDVLVLGLGKSGRAVCDYCVNLLGTRVASLTIAAGAKNDDALVYAQAYVDRGARVYFDSTDVEGAYDVCIASPGISEFSEFYQNAAAHSTEVISEVEFAWRESAKDSRWIAITGTNGKTTTTALITHLLNVAGVDARAVGNIGNTCIDEVAKHDTSCYVAEVSSYQLASTRYFKPSVAVLLNITPDHISWHKTFEAYAQAKQKIYANCGSGDAVVLDATNDVVRSMVREIKAAQHEKRTFAYLPMGTQQGLRSSMIEACGSENAVYLDGDVLTVEYEGVCHRLIPASELQIKGEHNASNALAAASAVIALGVCSDEVLCEGLRSFEPIEHRIEPCGSVAGVRCYNDSKATNVDATLKALAAFGDEKPLVLLGGHDKGTDLSELVAVSEKHVKAVVCFGAAGQRFFDAFEPSSVPTYRADHLEDALDCALDHAQSGDIVILSPACASFDEFSGFPERGRVFKSLVATRSQERGK